MADVNLTAHKTVGPFFSNQEEIVKVQYNFANDGGATASDFMLLTAGEDLCITDFYVHGITELDSAADGATIDLGVDGGDEDILLDGVAEASFAADAIVKPTVVEGAPNVMPLPLKLASGGKIRMKILGEALTSGACEFVFKAHAIKS